MTMTLYAFSGAPRPWRALLGLTIKQIPFEVRWLSPSAGDHRSVEMTALNARQQLPILDHDGHVVTESLAILAYVDALQPAPPLFGSSPKETAAIWQATLDADQFLRAATNALMRPVFGGRPHDDPDLRDGAELMRVELRHLEAKLVDGPFLLGARASAADAVAFPEIRLLIRGNERAPSVMNAVGLDDLATDFPRVHAWVGRIEALPGYGETFPVHWTEEKGR